jgi:oligosaccharide repeat unit polymerase
MFSLFIDMQFLKNPFYIYIYSFLSVIVVYTLGWSLLYPKLSTGLLLFLYGSFLISFFFGAIIDRYNPIRYRVIKEESNIIIILLLIYVFLFLEFINNRGIPLILVLKTDWYDYTKFGIKTLHTIFITFTSFYTVYLFHVFLSRKSFKVFLYLVLLMMIPVLIYNRGMFLINLISFLFVYLMSVKHVKLKIKIFIILGLFIILYFFGILGNYRMTKSISSDYFLEVSQASPSFKESVIPKEFMWTYIYVSSPLGNLENTISSNPVIAYRWKDLIVTELLPDFLSKRISPIVKAKRVEKINRLTSFMTVGTIYARSYILMGWIGMIIMMLLLMLGSFIYIVLLPRNSKYYVTGISILSTFMLFNTFTNMIYFSGISFQLIFPILLSIKIKRNKLVL